jgi:hypothetical protein
MAVTLSPDDRRSPRTTGWGRGIDGRSGAGVIVEVFEQMFEVSQVRAVPAGGGRLRRGRDSTPLPPERPPWLLPVLLEVRMRRYDDTIEVRRGLVNGTEAPEQFLWRGRLWLVHDVMAHWVETGAWWEQGQVRSLLGTDGTDGPGDPGGAGDPDGAEPPAAGGDLLAEREVWRVDAASGRAGFRAGVASGQRGVFDLVLDWGAGQWRLQHTLD